MVFPDLNLIEYKNYFATRTSLKIKDLQHFKFNFEPLVFGFPLQREKYWDLEMKTNFIWSILKNMPIGEFVMMYTKFEKMSYEVLDGKQRLTTIIEFLENDLEIKNIYNKTQHFKFSQMPCEYQEKFLNYWLDINSADEEKITDENILEMFFNVNAGVRASTEHLESFKEKYLNIC